MIYRKTDKIAAGDEYVDPPRWLIDGMLMCAPTRDHAPELSVLDAAEHVPSLDEFLQKRAGVLDSAGRELYRAYGYALVQLLIERRDGRSRLGNYIDNLALASNDPLADLQRTFPEARDDVWRSEINNLKLSKGEALLSFAQSDAKLNELLRTAFPSADRQEGSISLDQVSHIKLNSEQEQALQKFRHRLLVLATEANPMLRPIVEKYRQIAEQLALKRDRKVALGLAELNSLHEKLSKRMGEIDDYMNWFEAAKLERPSGLFEPEPNPELRATKRKDALSVYLDAMELEF
jgi:hypothetical protein